MHNKLRSLDSKKVQKILSYFGFRLKDQTGSHQHWIKRTSDMELRVDVQAKVKTFKRKVIASMIRQTRHSEEEWVKALDEL